MKWASKQPSRTPRPAPTCCRRRRDLGRAQGPKIRQAARLTAVADPRSRRRHRRHGPAHRPRARHRRRLLVRHEPVRPRPQAKRQPGSSFKPFVYAAAMDNGYKPTRIVLDAPIEIDQGPGKEPGGRRTTTSRSRSARDAAGRHREVAQPDDGAARPGHGHAADRRVFRAVSASMTTCCRCCRCRSAPARRRCCA